MPLNYNPSLQRDLKDSNELIGKLQKIQEGLSKKEYELYQEFYANINRFLNYMIPQFEKKLAEVSASLSDDEDIEIIPMDLECDVSLDINLSQDLDYDSVSEYEEEDPDINVLEIPEQIEYLKQKYSEKELIEKQEKLFEKKYMDILFKNIRSRLHKLQDGSIYQIAKIYE